ncbi:MAG: hypothetical protein NVS3B25_32340 [Hymenobacter sp.]
MLFGALAPAPTPTPVVEPAPAVPAWIGERLAYFQTPDFVFDPEPHTYTLRGRELQSATSWLKQYTEPFIPEERAPVSAARAGCSVDEILAKWEHNRWVGTRTHEHIENFYNGFPSIGTEIDPEVQLRYGKFLALHHKRLHAFTPIGQEIRVFHEAAGICGTLDYLAWHKEKQEPWCLDWKATKDLGNDQTDNYRRMRGPFADLWDHKLNVYSLQISLYRLMLEAQFIPTAGGAICWLPGGDTPAQVIPALDYRQRLRALLF